MDLTLAIGGRNDAKLHALRRICPTAGRPIAVVVGDSHDTAFMKAMSARTHVVASTAGPFALYGSELVAACAENGTHYCDLSAEPQWMRAMIDAHEDEGPRNRRADRACLRPQLDPVGPRRAIPAGGRAWRATASRASASRPG